MKFFCIVSLLLVHKYSWKKIIASPWNCGHLKTIHPVWAWLSDDVDCRTDACGCLLSTVGLAMSESETDLDSQVPQRKNGDEADKSAKFV